MENNYHRTIFVDVEPATEDPDGPLMEVAAVAVESATYRVIDTIDMKVEFEMRYLTDYKILGCNKFSAETWAKYALPEEVVAKKLAIFFNRYATVGKTSRKTGKDYYIPKLAGHNSSAFDAPRLKILFDKHGQFFHDEMLRTLDTQHKALWFFEDNPAVPQPDNYQLQTLTAYFGLAPFDAHSALPDARASVDLAYVLAESHRITAESKVA